MSNSGKKKKAKPSKKAATKKNVKVVKSKKVAKVAPVTQPKKATTEVKKAPAEKREPAAPKQVSVKVERPVLGQAPTASVTVRHIDVGSMHHRAARGFSFGELASAGVPLNAAKREGLSVDIRRRSVIDGNVGVLKGWFKSGESAGTGQAAVAVATKKKQGPKA